MGVSYQKRQYFVLNIGGRRPLLNNVTKTPGVLTKLTYIPASSHSYYYLISFFKCLTMDVISFYVRINN